MSLIIADALLRLRLGTTIFGSTCQLDNDWFNSEKFAEPKGDNVQNAIRDIGSGRCPIQ
jgi:hypothetical protein